MIEKNTWKIDPWIAQGEIPTAYAMNVLINPTTSRIKEKFLGADSIEQKKIY